MKKYTVLLITGAILAFGFLMFAVYVAELKHHYVPQGASLPTPNIFSAQFNEGGAVEVSVQPIGDLASNSGGWDFQVSLNTHSGSLDQDLAQNSILIAGGSSYRPLSWEGDPPGGHHQEGVLKFKAVAPTPASVTLVVQDVGDVKERKFVWQF